LWMAFLWRWRAKFKSTRCERRPSKHWNSNMCHIENVRAYWMNFLWVYWMIFIWPDSLQLHVFLQSYYWRIKVCWDHGHWPSFTRCKKLHGYCYGRDFFFWIMTFLCQFCSV
jgi:hypothetical protein